MRISAPSPCRRACFVARTTAALVACAALLTAGAAHADSALRLAVDWSKLADILRRGGATFAPEGGLRLGEEERPVPLRPSEEMPWVGSSPHVAVIARDWGGARGLWGGISLMDRMRLSRSSRMLVSRVRVADGRLVPFVQLGLGQWRIDTDLLPGLRRDVELAGQLGGGLELTIARSAVIAIEGESTVLYRDQHEPQMVCQPHLWSTLLAARFEF